MLLNEYPEIKNVIRYSGYFIVSVIEDTVKHKTPARQCGSFTYYLFTLHSSLFTFHFSLTYVIFGKVIK